MRPSIAIALLMLGCGGQATTAEPIRPLIVAPIDAGAPSASTTEVARGQIAVSLITESGTLVTFSTRPVEPVALLRPCIDDPKLAPRPLSPAWMLFAIAINYTGTTVELRESSAAADEGGKKLIACVTKALERVGNSPGLSRGSEHLVAYVSVR